MNDSDKIIKALEEITVQLKQLAPIQKDLSEMKQVQVSQGKDLSEMKQVQVSQGKDLSEMKTVQVNQGKDLSDLKHGQAHINTALEAFAEGQRDMGEQMAAKLQKVNSEMATKEATATKFDIIDMRADVIKKIKTHEKRLTAIEEELNLHKKN